LGGEIVLLKRFFNFPLNHPGRRLPLVLEDLIDQVIGHDQPQGCRHETDANKAMNGEPGGKTLVREPASQ
jgi:hypothetical protein